MGKADKKITVDSLSNNQVAVLYNIMHSGIQITAKLAKDFVAIQDWIVVLAKERKITTKKN